MNKEEKLLATSTIAAWTGALILIPTIGLLETIGVMAISLGAATYAKSNNQE